MGCCSCGLGAWEGEREGTLWVVVVVDGERREGGESECECGG